MKRLTLTTLSLSLLVLSTGCSYITEGFLIDDQRQAKNAQNDVFDDTTNKVVYLNQNWDSWDSLWFYNTTQGSTWMPYNIFLHLEQASSTELFRSDANMRTFRYLIQAPSYDNPDGLPVGLVKDEYQDNEFIGFTCAACHTTQLNYQNVGIRIDGGPAMADMEGLLLAMEAALKATLDDDNKLSRLVTALEEDEDSLRTRLHEVYLAQQFYNTSNAPQHDQETVHYGYARLDAFGRIYNRVLAHLTPNNKTNFNPANAPVSYPFLWDTPHADFVQWNGVGDNHDSGIAGFLGPLGRNTGEVLGVFASFELDNPKGIYRSSADKHNLSRLERHLKGLNSPSWPEDILPPINQQLAKQGESVYEEYRCGWCHNGGPSPLDNVDVFKPDDSSRLMIAQFATEPFLQTDWQMAKNALSYSGKTGYFEGQKIELGGNDKFASTSPVLPALSKAAQGVILAPDYDKLFLRRWLDQAYLFITTLFDNNVPVTQRHNDFEIVNKTPEMLSAYKGRTLNGIWATAPYLHNGSVPNLYELFMPSCSDTEQIAGKQCRSNRFTVGSHEFDPVKVGFKNKDHQRYPSLFLFDTSKPSNNNQGHEYAAGVTRMIKLNNQGKPMKNPDGSFETFTLPAITDANGWL